MKRVHALFAIDPLASQLTGQYTYVGIIDEDQPIPQIKGQVEFYRAFTELPHDTTVVEYPQFHEWTLEVASDGEDVGVSLEVKSFPMFWESNR